MTYDVIIDVIDAKVQDPTVNVVDSIPTRGNE